MIALSGQFFKVTTLNLRVNTKVVNYRPWEDWTVPSVPLFEKTEKILENYVEETHPDVL